MNIDRPLKTDIPALKALWKQAFGDTDAFLNEFFQTAFSIDRSRLVKMEGKIFAALYWFDCTCRGNRIAYLYAVATDKAYCGQGICRKLMADTHLYLAELGYEGVVLVPGSDGLFSFYETMGYRTCSYMREVTCEGVPSHLPFRSVDKSEYAALRRELLPCGGVIQERENLDFLVTQAKLYAGDTFLVAVCEREGKLYGVEALGDTAKLSGLVCALGYKEGLFRVPGEELPFAMYLPLTEKGVLPPFYFGLAFDL